MTVLVHAEIHGIAGRAADLRDLLAWYAGATAAGEAGAGSLGTSASIPLGADEGEFALDAWWRDEGAMRAHYATAAYARYVELVSPLLARPSDVQVHYVERSVRVTPDLSLDPTRQD